MLVLYMIYLHDVVHYDFVLMNDDIDLLIDEMLINVLILYHQLNYFEQYHYLKLFVEIVEELHDEFPY
jgi:hypothetical protein